jgi:probable rRNA maturation factor
MILIEPSMQARFGHAVRQRALIAFVREASAAAKLRGDVSVLLTGDEEIRKLNRIYRGKNKATDVLSFPAPDAVSGHEGVAGDLAVSLETAARQAQELGHSLGMELQILLLHGLLHLSGFDHETDEGEMARREMALRRRFGLRLGLIERTAGDGQRSHPVTSKSRRDKGGAPGARGTVVVRRSRP